MLGFVLDPFAKLLTFVVTFWSQEKNQKLDVDGSIDGYNKLHEASVDTRESKYAKLVNAYYGACSSQLDAWRQRLTLIPRRSRNDFL